MSLLDPPFNKSMAVYYDGLASGNGMKIVGRNFGFTQYVASASTDIGGTSRFEFIPVGALSRLACLVSSQRVLSSGVGTSEATGFTTINQICYEYNGYSRNDTKNGKVNIISEASGSMIQSDSVGLQIPALTPFYVRYYHTFAFLPSGTPTASAIAGGSLAAQAWYYVVTRVMQGIESSPTAEFTATTASSNLSIAITIIDTKSATADYYIVYRSATSGSTKQYIGQTNGRTKRFVDDGSYAVDANINPPASGQNYLLNRIMAKATDCSTHTSAGQDGRNVAFGAYTFSASGPSFIFGTTPVCVLGDDRSGKSVMVLGDSIFSGLGFGNQTGFYRQEKGMWEAAWNDGEINSLNWSFSGATVCEVVNPLSSGGGRSRLKSIAYADWLIDELGTNDIVLGRTWQQLAADKLKIADICKRNGVKYVPTTILPRGVGYSTGCLTIAGQTQHGTESERQSFNTWVRAGCPVTTLGVPDIAGTPSILVYSFIDIAASVEVNSSNVVALNGGYWKVPASPVATGLVLNGTPTATSLPITTSLVLNENLGRVIKFTSGVCNGQYCTVKSNTTSGFVIYAAGDTTMTGIPVPSLSNVPSAGDTFNIYDSCAADATHPGLSCHTQIAAVIRAWLLANVI